MAWSRAHEAKRQEILDLLSRKAKPFADVSDAAQAARRKLPFMDWCRTYLPHYFDVAFARFHEEMVAATGEPGMPTFMCAFRGCGKSVLLALARPLWRTLQREVPYWLRAASVQLLAAQNMDYVRIELEENERIRADYGEVRVEGDENEWTAELGRQRDANTGQWALTSCKFEAFGIGMSPRGKLHGPHRPLEFVGDDLENAELARNPRREQQLWDWMMDEVIPALEPQSYVFTVLGTMFGPDCMMERARLLAQKTDAQGRPLARHFLQRSTENGMSVWPERFPDAELARIRQIIGLRNWLRNFELSADDPTKPFQPAWFEDRYGRKEINAAELDVVAFLDPAISETGCPRALVCIGSNRKTGQRIVLDAWISRGGPLEMVEKLYAFHRRWRPRVLGVESNGGFALIQPLLGLSEAKYGYRLPVRYIPHTGNKFIRIETLCPEMQVGRWRWPEHPNEGVRTLIMQFLSYPDGFIDGPDATAGCGEMLPDAFAPRAPGEEIYKSLTKRRDLAGVL